MPWYSRPPCEDEGAAPAATAPAALPLSKISFCGGKERVRFIIVSGKRGMSGKGLLTSKECGAKQGDASFSGAAFDGQGKRAREKSGPRNGCRSDRANKEYPWSEKTCRVRS
jgi:hypothetical protein